MSMTATLKSRGVLTQEQIDAALVQQGTSGERLDRVLVSMGLADRATVLAALGEEFHMPVVDMSSAVMDPAVLTLLPSKVIFRQRCVPLRKEGSRLIVATSDPYDLASLDELRLHAGCAITPVLADDEELQRFIRENFGVGGDTLDALSGQAGATVEAKPVDEAEQAQEASVIRLVNDLLIEAVSQRATDVHIEPYERELAVRYRIDGVLEKANIPPTIHRFAPAIISRLKIMANLNIAEKRKPQDGRITFKFRPPAGGAPQEFDLRVSVIPMLFGEGVVLRVLSKAAVLMPLADLGMPQTVLSRWNSLVNRPHGIVLVTGPTGSGKSTTLYASLNSIVSDEVKVITVEDPVEYHVKGVNQIQVSAAVGLTFASGLRAILRHDPDVVMIGEIRDRETAETAVQASLTGHLVFSTLHTNDAAGSMTRLLDMGVEPFLVSSSLEGVLAQRLVRRICSECSVTFVPDHSELTSLPAGVSIPPGTTFAKGKGCRNCRNTGYRGRLGIYELLTISDETRHRVMERASGPVIAAAAMAEGNLVTLGQDAVTKALEHKTSLQEALAAVAR
jgi:type II secretory ATPase GspE/PulE/Tfp pilus assembly ATPase PilB-like protein